MIREMPSGKMPQTLSLMKLVMGEQHVSNRGLINRHSAAPGVMGRNAGGGFTHRLTAAAWALNRHWETDLRQNV